jgi:hypothetical protein
VLPCGDKRGVSSIAANVKGSVSTLGCLCACLYPNAIPDRKTRLTLMGRPASMGPWPTIPWLLTVIACPPGLVRTIVLTPLKNPTEAFGLRV